MRKFLLAHLLQLFFVIIIVSTLTFVFVRLAPGDPATIMLKANDVPASQEALLQVRQELGLTDSLGRQYIDWLFATFSGQWGNSYVSKNPVLHELLTRLPATLELAFAGLAVMVGMTLLLGICSALIERGVADQIGRAFALVGSAIPTFWFGYLCIYVFSVRLGWLPTMGRGTWQHLILPALTLGLGLGTIYARILRTHLIELRQLPFVKASKARGQGSCQLIRTHLLKHALLPVVTMLGTSFAFMLSGSIIVESIFSWPGIGRYIIDAINRRDYPVIQGYAIFAALLFVLIHTFVDAIYLLIDPRLRR